MESLTALLVTLFLLPILHSRVCEGAWVRKYPCESAGLRPLEKPFWIDSLHGKLHASDELTSSLALSILGVYDQSKFNCSDLDLASFKRNTQLHVLSYPVGHLESFHSQCPLPVSDSLTPPEGLSFSQFDMVLSFERVYRLETIFGDLAVSALYDKELDCAGVRITPGMGTATSAAIRYPPAVILILVGIASWQRHSKKQVPGPAFEHTPICSVWSMLWKIALDMADYLRYLQFVFLAGALTADYPGFYQPAVGQLSWSSLLYWAGPIDNGFTYPGVEDGIYVSNLSYGLDYMARMIAQPRVPDIMINSYINLVILIGGITAILSMLCLITGPRRQDSLTKMARNASWLIFGTTLSFFSFPLMAFMSNELRLIGYLPNYRVVIIAVLTTVFFLLTYVAHRHFENEQERADRQERTTSTNWMRHLPHYLPQAIPLLQGLVIGWVQDWGLAQILLLAVCETALLIYLIWQRRGKPFMLRSVWCATVRVLTLILSVGFALPVHEATRQWIGYFILCLHAAVLIFGYLLLSVCGIYRGGLRYWRHARSSQGSPLSLEGLFAGAGSYPASLRTSVSASYRGNHTSRPKTPSFSSSLTTPFDTRHYITDFSAFYRQPRQRSQNPITVARDTDGILPTLDTTSHLSLANTTLPRLGYKDTFDNLLNTPPRRGVDYSVRESDMFYGRPRSRSTCSLEESPSSLPQPGPATGSGILKQARRYLRRQAVGSKEQGFQVMRPPRPT
ncbi:hypothetical protein BDW60DRAFT_211414 [Aspergillus nidulans var. acristatus]